MVYLYSSIKMMHGPINLRHWTYRSVNDLFVGKTAVCYKNHDVNTLCGESSHTHTFTHTNSHSYTHIYIHTPIHTQIYIHK